MVKRLFCRNESVDAFVCFVNQLYFYHTQQRALILRLNQHREGCFLVDGQISIPNAHHNGPDRAGFLIQVLPAAQELRFPLVVKVNIGGAGAGIVRFDTLQGLQAAVEANQINLGIDQTALVQEFG